MPIEVTVYYEDSCGELNVRPTDEIGELKELAALHFGIAKSKLFRI
jgi:hypothetical protein